MDKSNNISATEAALSINHSFETKQFDLILERIETAFSNKNFLNLQKIVSNLAKLYNDDILSLIKFLNLLIEYEGSDPKHFDRRFADRIRLLDECLYSIREDENHENTELFLNLSKLTKRSIFAKFILPYTTVKWQQKFIDKEFKYFEKNLKNYDLQVQIKLLINFSILYYTIGKFERGTELSEKALILNYGDIGLRNIINIKINLFFYKLTQTISEGEYLLIKKQLSINDPDIEFDEKILKQTCEKFEKITEESHSLLNALFILLINHFKKQNLENQIFINKIELIENLVQSEEETIKSKHENAKDPYFIKKLGSIVHILGNDIDDPDGDFTWMLILSLLRLYHKKIKFQLQTLRGDIINTEEDIDLETIFTEISLAKINKNGNKDGNGKNNKSRHHAEIQYINFLYQSLIGNQDIGINAIFDQSLKNEEIFGLLVKRFFEILPGFSEYFSTSLILEEFKTQLTMKSVISLRQKNLYIVDRNFSPGHGERVGILSKLLISNILKNYPEQIMKKYGEDIKLIDKCVGIAGIFHDIGKIRRDWTNFTESGKKSDQLKEEIETHTKFGIAILQKEILGGLNIDKKLKNEIKKGVIHHENENGTGYHIGLKSHQIPLISKIIRIADSMDAALSKRVYRENQKRKTRINEDKNISLKEELMKDLKKDLGDRTYDKRILETILNATNEEGQNIADIFFNETYPTLLSDGKRNRQNNIDGIIYDFCADGSEDLTNYPVCKI